MRRKSILIIILLLLLPLSSGCTGEQDVAKSFSIPEAEKIQLLLDDMSAAVLEKNLDRISSLPSEDCPGRSLELDRLKKLIEDTDIKSYTQELISAERLRDGVVCTVSINWEGVCDGESIYSRSMRNMYFIFDKVAWRIGDFDYYPYMNPTVIVGSESMLYDAAYLMSEALDSMLRTDTEHLQAYGDIILVGTSYDNGSILDLEEKGLTAVKVTDDYPGSNLGIVQVLTNTENYRHVIIIQGSTPRTAEDSVRYMTEYLRDNPYMNPGVYFVDEDGIRRASPLETSTLVTLDMNKSSQRLKEVQKHMEANIEVIREELNSEREQLLREQRHLNNEYKDEYSKAFSRYEYHPEKSLFDSMVIINANFTDSSLCSSAFLLPYGSNSGTAYTFGEYLNRSLSLSTDKDRDDKGPLLGTGAARVHSAHEIYDTADELEISLMGTALLRLTGFSADEVYSTTAAKGHYVFFNIDGGYALKPGASSIHTPKLRISSGKLLSVYNDSAFLSYENNLTNLELESISAIYDRIGEVYLHSGRPSGKAPAKAPFGKSEFLGNTGLSSDTEDVYNLLRSAFITDDSPCLYSTLDEARDKLREAMGALLAVKCTRFMVNGASRYPSSQFDYARYAAGLINVENPKAYAEAAESSRLLKDLSGGISNLLTDASEKSQKLADILRDIPEEERESDMLSFPDHCITNNKGSHRDKALLAFGLYGSITGSTESAYVALGENSSYLVFEEEGQWKYLDCKYHDIKGYINDEIYVVFNKEFVYNGKLGIGDIPDFVR